MPIYAMVFATSNQAGKDIMLHLYEKAAREAPRRRELVKAERDGAVQMPLGLGDEIALKDPLWTQAPWKPPS